MSQGFKTEADVMRNTAHRVDDTNQEVSAELSRLRSIVDGVRASWEGTAQVSFDNLMQRWDASAKGLQDALQSISDNIRGNATSFENVEADNQSAFSAVGGQELAL